MILYKKSKVNGEKMEKDIYFMRKALEQAGKAYKINEVPVGAVIVKDGKIIARGYNKEGLQKIKYMEANRMYNVCYIRTM